MNPRAEWKRYVERRRAELHDRYPCAAPTRQRICPKHRTPVPQTTRSGIQLTAICTACRESLYEQLATEYLAAQEQQREGNPA